MFKLQERKIHSTKPEGSTTSTSATANATKVVNDEKTTTPTTTTDTKTQRSQSRPRTNFSFSKIPNRVPSATNTTNATSTQPTSTPASLKKDDVDSSQTSMSRNSFSSLTGLFNSRRSKCLGGVCLLFVLLPLAYLFGIQKQQQPQNPYNNVLWDNQAVQAIVGGGNYNGGAGAGVGHGGPGGWLNSGGPVSASASEWMRTPNQCEIYCDHGCQLDEATCSCLCQSQPLPQHTMNKQPQPQQMHHVYSQREPRQLLMSNFIQFIVLPTVLIVFLFGACMIGRICAGGPSRHHSHRGRSRTR